MKQPKYKQEWSDDVKALYKHDMEQYWDRSLSVHQWNQYKNLLDTYFEIAKTTSSNNILDVGCAQATLALLLAEHGQKVTAVDIRQEFLDYAESRYEEGNIKFIQGNALELKFDEKFDLIFANQIIEHLVYPVEMISGLLRLLNDEGVLVVSTPNWAYLKNTLPCFQELGNPKDWEHMQFTADGDGHFFAYKEEELHSIFREAGFSEINSHTFETPFVSGHMKVRFLHKLLPYSILKAFDHIFLRLPKIKVKLSHQLMIIAKHNRH